MVFDMTEVKGMSHPTKDIACFWLNTKDIAFLAFQFTGQDRK